MKARRYPALGVPHYWIVDPEASRIECYRADGGSYTVVAQAQDAASLSHPDWPDLVLSLGDLWQ